ncbi:MAG: hypothetical protein PHC64_10900 [Candidatus Gastranaerophilales bacterium]|nr:hypothetical protein [Candidatus Gastranaerophilales bacterium]
MKRNIKILQINGFRGLFLTLFIMSCLIAGFIAFPAFLSMNVWNYFSIKLGSFPSINFFQGVLLWAILVFSVFVFNRKKFIVSFSTQQELTEDEVKSVISRIKSQTEGKEENGKG